MRVIELSEMPRIRRDTHGAITDWLDTISAFPDKAVIVHRTEFPTEKMRAAKKDRVRSFLHNAVQRRFGRKYFPMVRSRPNDEFAIAIVKREPKAEQH